MKILDRIRCNTLEVVERARRRVPEMQLREQVAALSPARGFARAIRAGRGEGEPRAPGRQVRVIAEVKKASPSVGVIRADFDPEAIARSYETGGAAAISCLTDEKFFMGSLEFLRRIRQVVSLPILRKEFMLDPYQVWEARAAGADAILLIVDFVEDEKLHELRRTAREAGLDVLVEIHRDEELERALALEPVVLGINNRDLQNEKLMTNLGTTLSLVARVPPLQTLISESGIRTRQDVAALAKVGVDGILVGEHLMREPEPGAAIAGKLGAGSRVEPGSMTP